MVGGVRHVGAAGSVVTFLLCCESEPASWSIKIVAQSLSKCDLATPPLAMLVAAAAAGDVEKPLERGAGGNCSRRRPRADGIVVIALPPRPRPRFP